MNQGQRPAFGLSFDPRALTDLLQAPSDIRDRTLAYLQEVVNAKRFGTRLTGDLEGYRKLFVDARRAWRVVYGVRPAPRTSAHAREIYVVAVRPRPGIYDEVGRRLGMRRRPLSARTHAARSRSPQLAARHHPVSRRVPLPSAMPGLPRPAQSASPLHTR
ncbi:hypothetical protein QWJ26_39960 [Streptomyces sp. CSDS2]|uniref:type II toxin-antitoxin system RelE family toxin n=1 Tax=Streptomyces sp. CSDS2 TaxID=3055051 RepID=UPI0025B0FAB2|nr:hypothetical protein [Streptomyces sp. CSDS2]MDN3265861.1 hypothetical protein [Streptomyces sp. CSDS2]